MDSDSGLPQSPTLEEDYLNYDPKSDTTASANRIHTLCIESSQDGFASKCSGPSSTEVSPRKHHKVTEEEDDVERAIKYSTLLSGGLFPQVNLDQEPNVEPLPVTAGSSNTAAERTSAEGDDRPRSVSEYSRSWSADSNRTKRTKTANKYRISFVELSDSSEESEKDDYHATITSIAPLKKSTVISLTQSKHSTSSKRPLSCGLPVKSSSQVQQPLVQQVSDLWYDDEEMDALIQNTNGLLDGTDLHSNTCFISPKLSTQPRERAMTFPSHKKAITQSPAQSSHTLEWEEDKDLEFELPTAYNGTTTTRTNTTSSKFHHYSLSSVSLHVKSNTSDCSSQQSTVVKVKGTNSKPYATHNGQPTHHSHENSKHESNGRAQLTRLPLKLDHSSSPLHKMSTEQLQYIIRLLETKLQGRLLALINFVENMKKNFH